MDDSIYEYYSGRVVVVGLPTGFLSLAFPNEFPIQLLGSFRVPKACSIFVSPFFLFFFFNVANNYACATDKTDGEGPTWGFLSGPAENFISENSNGIITYWI
jgi:hypothetical protein